MAYVVASGAILEASIKGRYQGQRILSLFHYRYISTSPPADGLTTINDFNAKFNTVGAASVLGAYCQAAPEDYTCEEVVYQWLSPTRRARVPKTPALVAGSRASDPAPTNISIFIEKLSDMAGRHGHGGLHWGLLLATDYDGNTLSLGGIANLDTLRTRMAESVNLDFGIDMVPLIFNRAAPTDSVEVTGTVVKEGVRTMHRRTVGVGE